MNKLLKVSLIAMLAVGPVSAFAELPAKYMTLNDGVPTETTSKPAANAVTTQDIASTGYVIGAYNAAIGAVNEVNTEVGKKQNQLKNGSGDNAVNMDAVVAQSVSSAATASSTKLVSESAVRSAINDAISDRLTEADLESAAGNGLAYDTGTDKMNVDLAATNAGLSFDSDGKLKASIYEVGAGTASGTIRVNGSDVAVTGLGDAAFQSAGSFDVAGAASAVEDKLGSGATGYAINAQSLQVQGTDVLTQSTLTNNYTATDTTHAVTGSAVAAAISGLASEGYVDSKITSSYDTSATGKAVNAAAVNKGINSTNVVVHTTWGSTATATATGVLQAPTAAIQ